MRSTVSLPNAPPLNAALTQPLDAGIDAKMTLRQSHKNPAVLELYKDFLQGAPNSEQSHHLLHTHYTDRSGEVKGRTDQPFGLPATMPVRSVDEHH